MSKRFGRNQRRRAKAENATLTEQRNHWRKSYEMRSSQIDKLNYQQTELCVILGEFFGGFDPKTVQGNKDRHFLELVDLFSNEPECVFDQKKRDDLIQKVTLLNVVNIEALKVNLAGCQHVRVEFGNKTFGYAISSEMLRKFPKKSVSSYNNF